MRLVPDAPDYPDDEGRRQNLQEGSQHLRGERRARRVEFLEPEAEVEKCGGESPRPGNEVEDEAEDGQGQRQNGARPLEGRLPIAYPEHLDLAHLAVGAAVQHVLSIVQLKIQVVNIKKK